MRKLVPDPSQCVRRQSLLRIHQRILQLRRRIDRLPRRINQHRQRRRNQQNRQAQRDIQRRASGLQPSQDPFVHRIEKNRQHRRPCQRLQKRLHDSKRQVNQQQQRAVRKYGSQPVARACCGGSSRIHGRYIIRKDRSDAVAARPHPGLPISRRPQTYRLADGADLECHRNPFRSVPTKSVSLLYLFYSTLSTSPHARFSFRSFPCFARISVLPTRSSAPSKLGSSSFSPSAASPSDFSPTASLAKALSCSELCAGVSPHLRAASPAVSCFC